VNAALLLLGIGLIAANGFFVGAEFAVLASRRARLEPLLRSSRRARGALYSWPRSAPPAFRNLSPTHQQPSTTPVAQDQKPRAKVQPTHESTSSKRSSFTRDSGTRDCPFLRERCSRYVRTCANSV
jgi:hypothetical protein